VVLYQAMPRLGRAIVDAMACMRAATFVGEYFRSVEGARVALGDADMEARQRPCQRTKAETGQQAGPAGELLFVESGAIEATSVNASSSVR
jgi:hypothetical protein